MIRRSRYHPPLYPRAVRRTRIIATLGPSSSDEHTLRAMIEAGMDIARLNYSHGSLEDKSALIRVIRLLEAEMGRPIGILADLPGPKLRLGRFDETFELEEGGLVAFHCGQSDGRYIDIRAKEEAIGLLSPDDISEAESMTHIPVPEAMLSAGLDEGDPVLVADGLLRFVVEYAPKEAGKIVILRTVDAGPVSERKGINLPGTLLGVPSMTEKDIIALDHALLNKVDFIAVSYVRSAEDLIPVQKRIKEEGVHTPVIAKIEHPLALESLDEILDVCGGVMVARGDLGVEIPLAELPLAQERIIRDAQSRGLPATVATQMLESMIHSPRPTRAEVTDIATAIRQGASSIMLSGETAMGSHPVAAVKTMADIANRVDQVLVEVEEPDHSASFQATRVIVHAAVVLAHEIEANRVLVCTEHATAARLAAAHRPRQMITALTTRQRAERRTTLFRGVDSVLVTEQKRARDTINDAIQLLLKDGRLSNGDMVVTTSGSPDAITGATSAIRALRITNDGELTWP